MKQLLSGVILMLILCGGCTNLEQPWREQKLPSGKAVKVTLFQLVWGAEHDERRPNDDCLALEFVMTNPAADADAREAEALDVFELVRPVSEQWGFRTASLAGFQSTRRKGAYDLYSFRRNADGSWSHQHSQAKVFIDD